MAIVKAVIGEVPYAVTITAGSHELVSDEGPALGGQAAGPDPYDLVLAGLGACTAITLRMYARRKAWPPVAIQVALRLAREEDAVWIERAITLDGDIDETQRGRLADIAERTPVTLTLKQGLPVLTHLVAS